MANQMIRGLAADGQVRALAIQATALVEEARSRHQTWPTATAALGRSLMAVALMGAALQDEETITLRIIGDGPLGGIIAQASARGKVRGYVQEPQTDLPPKFPGKLDVGGAVGHGHLYVTKNLGLKEPYTGTATLVSGEIAEDLTQYFVQSEQTPTVVALGVQVDPNDQVLAAGGYFVQLMPGATEKVISQLEQNVAGMAPVSELVAKGMSPQDILQLVLAGLKFEQLESQDVSFECPCSFERLGGVLVTLGWQELAEMVIEGGAELNCHFCGEVYRFSKADLEELMKQLK